ncbi:M15 family metallopeptidase [Pseudoxanthomonas wuyuanensis]|uniref:D-alanyl-D-alanine carboxypeptidase n=1 Tax=Pseudoxanthomonas wuyuanensis TaxID=1073196 RepID=A0A286DGE8_9GAMM|nr:M15 family metallopeptidase [Pseudoxanthomonas wuyuanensis]KAF1719663.1 peptidase [Pseudoxanthomonas wuyuanensis]SOD57738.1 D-alanyl-D-alanine carboxypeptidase [Pseudoxanthomonas wuyuanensis]
MRRPAPPIPLKTSLLNTPDIELWPAGLLRARGNADARILARADRVLRRKRDGRYLAALLPQGVLPLLPRLMRESGIDAALDAADALDERRGFDIDSSGELPLARLQQRLHALGLDESYGDRTGLALIAEPAALALAGYDRYRRPLWLTQATARAWNAMRHAAGLDGIVLDAISGYRSHDYQLGIFERKLARGQTVQQILGVNAAPGYSEHHSGRALDIGTPGEPPAEESFERTPAFAWLSRHAAEFGFVMSYPRDNPHGIVYEPWHWRYETA